MNNPLGAKNWKFQPAVGENDLRHSYTFQVVLVKNAENNSSQKSTRFEGQQSVRDSFIEEQSYQESEVGIGIATIERTL